MTQTYSATPAQEALLIEQLLGPDMGANNLAYAYRVSAQVDLQRLADSVITVIEAAAPLADTFHRTAGRWLGHREDRGPKVECRQLAPLGSAEAELEAVVGDLGRSADQAMDPEEGPLFRGAVVQGHYANYLTLLSSHLVCDGYTAYALTSAISGLYNGKDVHIALERLSLGPESFPRREVEELALERMRADLAGAATLGSLTLDGQAPGLQQAGRRVERLADRALVDMVQDSALVQEWGTFPVLLAAHAKTCSILGDRPDVLINLPLANRRGVAQRGACGYFVNSLLMHLPVDELSTRDLVALAATRLRTLQRHQELNLSANLATIAPQLDVSMRADNAFTAYKESLNFSLDGGTTTLLPVPRHVVNQHLTITVAATAEDLLVESAGPDEVMLADPGSIYLDCLRTLVDPTSDHRAHLLPAPAAVHASAPTKLDERAIGPRFRELAERFPARTAVVEPSGVSLTYQELLERCELRVAECGYLPGAPVLVSRPRGIERVISMLATQLAGSVHVPVEPKAPASRVQKIVATLRKEYGTAPVLDGHHGALPDGILTGDGDPSPARDRCATPATDAYMLFTSGTTGTPKAIPISNRQVLDFVDAFLVHHDIGPDDRWMQFHSTVFDFSVLEVFAPLLSGGSLVVLTDEDVLDPKRMFALAKQHKVTVLCQTPSAIRRWRPVHIASTHGYSWRRLLMGAEELNASDLDLWYSSFGDMARVFNLYGPTETTVAATSQEVVRNDPSSLNRGGASVIGHPLPGVQVHVVDRHGVPVPTGVEGEIAICGQGVGRGYLTGQPAGPTRFEESAWLGRTYFSGDRARRHPDGALTYLGRRDGQVQVRGHRVELGEVRSVLLGLPGVRAAHVATVLGTHGERELVACAIGEGLDTRQLRGSVARRLPSYMVPSRIEVLANFPLNDSGKLDEPALLRVFEAHQPRASESTSPLEQRVAEIFAETIGIPGLDPDTGFMDAGGTSMHLVAAHERLTNELQWKELDLVDIFSAGTARRLAAQFATTQSQ